MTYAVKEMYYTLQGEGAQVGRAAVFLRFAGCNLWTGLERDRASAVCQFCDTDFVGTDGVGGGKFVDAQALADAVAGKWPDAGGKPYVVCTGGEPLLQLDDAAIAALHAKGFAIGIETNGTQVPPAGIDWICVSPKADAELVLTRGDELKLIYPQARGEPERYAGLGFDHFFLQPLDNVDARHGRDPVDARRGRDPVDARHGRDPMRESNTAAAIAYCLDHPQWRLSLQTHKLTGIR
ncbi:MAG TPA: 7-carboxy-7-deazaguanine synthase [Rhizomicrobium sp.]|jgi:7-carboxy-7-deazaguanine synthase (Cx14CxxC type)|nr:7-carboxy-7-deazaguanine synthase [Rhizomicrobium sp.]